MKDWTMDSVLVTINMKNCQLTLEISESLFQKLEKLSELTEEPINELVIQMITNNIVNSTQKANELNELLAINFSESLPEVIEIGELVGAEVF
ncbi:MAG: hypothetical protein VKK07_09325 [Merismopediaceae bacterium]|nr:hypothetical protein [Merismopediaceae bacterium]